MVKSIALNQAMFTFFHWSFKEESAMHFIMDWDRITIMVIFITHQVGILDHMYVHPLDFAEILHLQIMWSKIQASCSQGH